MESREGTCVSPVDCTPNGPTPHPSIIRTALVPLCCVAEVVALEDGMTPAAAGTAIRDCCSCWACRRTNDETSVRLADSLEGAVSSHKTQAWMHAATADGVTAAKGGDSPQDGGCWEACSTRQCKMEVRRRQHPDAHSMWEMHGRDGGSS